MPNQYLKSSLKSRRVVKVKSNQAIYWRQQLNFIGCSSANQNFKTTAQNKPENLPEIEIKVSKKYLVEYSVKSSILIYPTKKMFQHAWCTCIQKASGNIAHSGEEASWRASTV